jgi:hypothetical protein
LKGHDRIKSQVLASAPVSFKATVCNINYDPEEVDSVVDMHEKQLQRNTLEEVEEKKRMFPTNLFSCIADTSCFGPEEDAFRPKLTQSTLSNTAYTSLTPTPIEGKYIEVATKKPTWNSELNQWTHFFGGRVKIPHCKNFLATTTPGSIHEAHYNTAAEDHTLDRVCIRHGMVRACKHLILCYDNLLTSKLFRFPQTNIVWTSAILSPL